MQNDTEAPRHTQIQPLPEQSLRHFELDAPFITSWRQSNFEESHDPNPLFFRRYALVDEQ